MEGLEVRALLATIPAAVTSGSLQNLSTMMGNIGGTLNVGTNSTEEVVDPQDPSKIVAVWDVNDTTMAAVTVGGEVTAVEAAYTVHGGQTWVALFSEPTNVVGLPSQPSLLNPATSGPTVPYAYQTNPDVGFDNSNNFYILTEYSSGAAAGGVASSGALVLQRYDFSGSIPTAFQFTNNEQDPNLYAGGGGFNGSGGTGDLKVIYQWLSSGNDDGVIDPTLTVDDNQATLPPSVSSQVDPNSGNVYVSWTTVDQPVYEDPLGPDFNPYRIMTTVSSDGGNNFGPVTVADVNSGNANDVNGEQGAGNGPATSGGGGMRDFNPAITVSQGRAPSESGLSGDPGIPGGQVTETWDDAAGNTLMANTISAGHDTSFGQQQEHFIPVASTDTTDFKINVNLSNITDLTTLDARVDIIDPNDQYLGLVLIAPNGQTFTLQFAVALTGGNEGVVTYTSNNIADYELGTIFDDNATRIIGDLSESAPYIGDYVPDGDRGGFGGGGGGTLDSFVKSLGSSVNGTWTLETIDANTSTSASPGFLLDWSLSFGRGLTADNDVAIPGNGLVVPISATGVPTTVVPASGAPIGPNVSMAVDNTLGAFSPYEGRIYAAFTGYYNVTVDGIKNPATNTDVFLTFSDDGGRTWSAPEEINQDNSQIDGLTGAEETNPDDLFTGRTQFQPSLTVDPATGTLVAAWRDASADPNNTLVATEIATSIDGGASFSPESYANPSLTATDAIDTQTQVVLSPEGDNGSSTNAADTTYGFGTSLGLAAYDGQVYPLWTGNLNKVTVVNGTPTLDSLFALFQPMVIAAGPRVVNSTQGPIPYAEAQSGNVTFTVTFDRPINPPGIAATFTPADVEVFYHDTTSGTPSVPVDVTGITPVASSGVGANAKFGYTEFTVSFNPSFAPGGGSSGISDFTGTYSYLIAPDDGAGDPIEAPVSSYVVSPVPKPTIGPIASTQVPLSIPISGTGGTGTADDFTTSRLTVNGFVNQIITGITVNLTLTHQDGADLVIRLTAPDGQSALVYRGTANGPLTLNNAAFVAQGDTGGPVDGTYTLSIDDTQSNNVGTLTGWSVTINSELPTLGLQPGAPMDQNADGTPDENPMTLPNGYTGLTPGDVYAVPTPELTAPVTFTTAQSILSPPFNTNTLPLIVPGPQIASTQAVGVNAAGQQQVSTGTDDLLMDNTSDQFQVTFDRPVQTSSFTGAQVQSITGPVGLITGPQPFASTAVDQSIPAATRSPAGVVTDGTLSSTISVNSNKTLTVADLTVSLSIAATSDAGLSAVLISPNGTQIPLFANLSGANLVNTVFDDSAENYITQGAAVHRDVQARLGLGLGDPLQPRHHAGRRHLDPPGHQHLDRPRRHARHLGAEHHADDHRHAGVAHQHHRRRQAGDGGDHVLHRLPPAAAQRHLHDPARPRHPGPVRQRDRRDPERRPRRAPRRGPERADHHGRVHGRRHPQGHPGVHPDRHHRRPDPGLELLDHRGARQLRHRRRQDRLRPERDAGPAQHQLRRRPRPDGDPVALRPRRRADGDGHPLQRRRPGPEHGQLRQHRPRRQRRHAHRGGQRAVLRHVRPAAVAGQRLRPGHRDERPGHLGADPEQHLDGRRRQHQRLVADLPEARAHQRPGRAGPGPDGQLPAPEPLAVRRPGQPVLDPRRRRLEHR